MARCVLRILTDFSEKRNAVGPGCFRTDGAEATTLGGSRAVAF
jgi:hypothetical protein